MHSVSKYGWRQVNGGRDITVTYVDGVEKKTTDLFQYWDSALVQKTIKDRPHFWFSGWTHMNNLSRQLVTYEEDMWKKAENKTEIFNHWATTTFKDSCSRAWRQRNKQPQYTRMQMKLRALPDYAAMSLWPTSAETTNNEREMDFLVPNDFVIPANHLFADFDLIKHKILLGGLRLSFVINHILTHKDAKKLRTGSAVQLQNSKETRKHTHALLS